MLLRTKCKKYINSLFDDLKSTIYEVPKKVISAKKNEEENQKKPYFSFTLEEPAFPHEFSFRTNLLAIAASYCSFTFSLVVFFPTASFKFQYNS